MLAATIITPNHTLLRIRLKPLCTRIRDVGSAGSSFMLSAEHNKLASLSKYELERATPRNHPLEGLSTGKIKHCQPSRYVLFQNVHPSKILGANFTARARPPNSCNAPVSIQVVASVRPNRQCLPTDIRCRRRHKSSRGHWPSCQHP